MEVWSVSDRVDRPRYDKHVGVCVCERVSRVRYVYSVRSKNCKGYVENKQLQLHLSCSCT